MIKLSHFNKIEPYLLKSSIILAIIFLSSGMYYALFDSPSDYQQQDFVRIMYVHVPSAWMSLWIYSFMGICSISYLIWHNQIMDSIARKSAIVGLTFSAITLITGSLWGKPIWGTWWVWDARLTSMLILFFLYLGYISLCSSLKGSLIPSFAPAILSVVGVINIPIIKFSVNLWTTLHQPASIMRVGGPSIHYSMMLPLILMFLGCAFLFVFITIIRVKTEILEKKILRVKIRCSMD